MSRPTYCLIDLPALRNNAQKIRELAPYSRMMAILKADAYGHGAVEIAHALKTADAFGVCCLEEALVLRNHGIKKPIILLEGFFEVRELQEIAVHNLEVVLHQEEQLIVLEKSRIKKPLKVWLKINIGMNRLGFSPQEFKKILKRCNDCDAISKPIRLMTHFANSNDIHNAETCEQINHFKMLVKDNNLEMSLANSAAILAWPQTHSDWIRPGAILYGISPFANQFVLEQQFKPVMTLSSKIIAIRDANQGETIGYGNHTICTKKTRVGVVAIGYADGYPRSAKNGTPVMVNQHIVPLLGRVSMDMLTVDLSELPNTQVGDPVILWGDGLPVQVIADYSNTFAYELVCGVNQRVTRIYREF